jgi:hypothetical protein
MILFEIESSPTKALVYEHTRWLRIIRESPTPGWSAKNRPALQE